MTVELSTCRIAEIDAADEASLDVAYQIRVVAQDHDLPQWPRPCRRRHHASFRHPWPGSAERHWLASLDGVPAGYARLDLPQLDNLDNAWAEILVRPDRRRLGVGRALYEHVVGQARAAGRRRLMGESSEAMPGGPAVDPAGSAFARAAGMTDALRDVRRLLDMSATDLCVHDRLLAEAWRHADGYSLVKWRDRAPAELRADIAYLDSRLMLDAPTGDLAWGQENVDAERVRRAEETRLIYGERCYSCAVRHDASGRLVALTALTFEESVPEHAWQLITLVDPPHRGHRLGTIVKLENLRYALAGEPALRFVDTWNAAVNAHMIAINDAMGFRPLHYQVNWQQTISSG
jgi:GNAT superfamily N-acetyltransferase